MLYGETLLFESRFQIARRLRGSGLRNQGLGIGPAALRPAGDGNLRRGQGFLASLTHPPHMPRSLIALALALAALAGMWVAASYPGQGWAGLVNAIAPSLVAFGLLTVVSMCSSVRSSQRNSLLWFASNARYTAPELELCYRSQVSHGRHSRAPRPLLSSCPNH